MTTGQSVSKLNRYDSIIIGAGHNGLVCAAYLAKQGQKVLVLESTDLAGGLAASREFHAGFKASVAHSVNHFPQKIIRVRRSFMPKNSAQTAAKGNSSL